MTDERRQHARVQRPFEGFWSGASGAMRCRIADISLGGCFVQSLAAPAVGERTVVTVTFGDTPSMSFAGTVAYVENGMGFAVTFDEVAGPDRQRLDEFLKALSNGVRS